MYTTLWYWLTRTMLSSSNFLKKLPERPKFVLGTTPTGQNLKSTQRHLYSYIKDVRILYILGKEIQRRPCLEDSEWSSTEVSDQLKSWFRSLVSIEQARGSRTFPDPNLYGGESIILELTWPDLKSWILTWIHNPERRDCLWRILISKGPYACAQEEGKEGSLPSGSSSRHGCRGDSDLNNLFLQ